MKRIFEHLRNGFLPVAPSMNVTIERDHLSSNVKPVNNQTILLCLFACVLGAVSAGVAQFLTHLIGFVTNLFFYHRISSEFIDPYNIDRWGYWVIGVPVFGGLIVGFMARFGSQAIRGHGIPEAMESILTKESRIPLRMTFLNRFQRPLPLELVVLLAQRVRL